MKNRKIVLGVTGGIAAYKSVELLRELKQRGIDVTVVMTESARHFVSKLTLQTLSGNEVRDTLFSLDEEQKIGHIELAQSYDAILVAPSTANMISKHALGLCDDLLSTLLCASTVPVIHAPAMNGFMLQFRR